jgi:hypothetical protein
VKGAKPADSIRAAGSLPVSHQLKIAKTLDVNVPQILLDQADEVIE